MDTVYPEPLSRLHRRVVKKKVHKNNSRYRTQPVTFAEIQEVDEEVQPDEAPPSSAAVSKSELDLKAKFEEFKKQRDKDLWESSRISNNKPLGSSHTTQDDSEVRSRTFDGSRCSL